MSQTRRVTRNSIEVVPCGSTLACMAAPRIKITRVIEAVLGEIMSAPPDDPAWGLRICEDTEYGPGTVYPALDRLMKADCIEDHWEDPKPADRPRRRFYTVTSAGRAAIEEDQRRHEEARRNRESRRSARRTASGLSPGGGVA